MSTNDEDRALALLAEEAETRVRRMWLEGQWWFSVVDVVALLTESPTPNKYWTDMKRRITDEGFVQLAASCRKFKAKAPDGKMRETEFADTEAVLRIVQSIPSPKAEPFKQWLAQVGTQRLQEMEDPALAAERMRTEYQCLGYSDAWITERLKNILCSPSMRLTTTPAAREVQPPVASHRSGRSK